VSGWNPVAKGQPLPPENTPVLVRIPAKEVQPRDTDPKATYSSQKKTGEPIPPPAHVVALLHYERDGFGDLVPQYWKQRELRTTGGKDGLLIRHDGAGDPIKLTRVSHWMEIGDPGEP
jgi:hypothetical protein